MTIKVNENISLVSIDHSHATAIFNLVDSNRDHLKQWLPWVDKMQTVENFKNHISDCIKREADQTDYAFVILYNDVLAGRIGIHYIDNQNKIASLGYWLGNNSQGKGIITNCCTSIIKHCFTALDLNRIEIKCAVENYKSRKIPEKLNFFKEGVIREGELLNDGFTDILLYSLLKTDWQKV